MKIKRKLLTPEQQEELDRNWEYMCSLILRSSPVNSSPPKNMKKKNVNDKKEMRNLNVSSNKRRM